MSFKKYWPAFAAVAAVILIYFLFFNKKEEAQKITVEVKKGNFKDQVESSGELQAEFSEDIVGPSGLSRFNIYEVKIENMVPEGTEVKAGEFIASLDKSQVTTQINQAQVELQKASANLSQNAIDTALSLSQARVNMRNLAFDIRKKTLTVEQSKYEPPATIKEAELELEKSKRELIKAREDYALSKRKEDMRLSSAELEVKIQRDRITSLEELQKSFMINAPKNGLLIYKTDWRGNKTQTGSTLNLWDPKVATLPDLSSMLTKTYINEVDIRKIKKDQKVEIAFDAFPNIKLAGHVVKVANMGETQANSDSKVFEVMIKLDKLNPAIKPGMSTKNAILITEQKNRLIVPLDAIFTEKNLSFAYVKNGSGIDKKEVKVGLTNENEAVVEKGLSEHDEVYLLEPESAKKNSLVRLSK